MRIPRWAEPAGRRALRARVGATAAAWPLLRRLPGDSTRLGPPRRFAESLPDWARGHPEVEITNIDDPAIWEPPLPSQPSSETPVLFDERRRHELFGTWLSRIPGGRVFGSHSTVIANDDTVFAELRTSWPKTYPYHDVLRRVRLSTPTPIKGCVAVLAAELSNSYHHWLVDIVPRLRLLGSELQRADRIVVPSGLGFQRECLEAAGVSMDRLIQPHRRLHLVAEELLVPSLVPRVADQTVPYLQSLFADQLLQERPFRRLYATRANAWRRRVANEEELVAALEPLGFETVMMDGLSVGEQARMFSEAEIVVGPDGGALTNIVFSQPGVTLVELFDSNYIIVGFWELTARVGGNYHLLVTPSPPTSSQWRDITAPVDKLLSVLEACGIA